MYNFKYVTASQLFPVRQNLISIINSAQYSVRNDFTFQFCFVGSVEHNMVTYDPKSNIGYDFDVDLHVNVDRCNLSPKEIKMEWKNALDKVAYWYGYGYAEDSTRVLTIKVKDRQHSKILHSCDFAIVNDYVDEDGNERQEYIHFNKRQKTYSWQEQPQGYYLLPEKEEWVKDNGYWQEVRDLYLDKKNRNNNPHKKSRSIYAETIHEICQRYGYYNR